MDTLTELLERQSVLVMEATIPADGFEEALTAIADAA